MSSRSRSPTRTRSGSRPSVRPSTTSPHTSSPDTSAGDAQLLELIDALPRDLRARVFTHASWAEARSESYERLEFLGDSVLGLAIARELYERFPEFPEGKLAKLRAHIVSRQSCAVVGRRLELANRLAAAAPDVPPDEVDRLSASRNVVSALIEAALGALYVENGFEPIQPAIVAAFQDRIEYAFTRHVDYKTELQEELARLGSKVSYSVLSVDGPPHERRFTAAAAIDGEEAGVGEGSSKKAAEQEAAREALAKVRVS